MIYPIVRMLSGLSTALALVSCEHVPQDSAQRHFEEGLRKADKIILVHMPPPAPYVMPSPTLGEALMGAPVPYAAGAALVFATGAALHMAELSVTKPQRRSIQVTASLDVVSSIALSRYIGRTVVYESEGPTARGADPNFVDRYVGDLRAKQFPTEPIIVFQIIRWGVDRGAFRKFQLYYSVSASVYFADQPTPIRQSDCLGTPTTPPLDSLTAEREAYLADGGALLNEQTRLAAERCGGFLVQEFPPL